MLLEERKVNGYERVVVCHDEETGLHAIIAVHSTKLGPALGGCRVYNYANEAAALEDVLRLSRGMTYKSAVAKIKLGGGKSVIIGDPKKITSQALFNAFGKFVDSFKGKYITAEDVGTTPECMKWIREETKYVVGVPSDMGGTGDPSPITAHGVFEGIRAAVKYALKRDDLKGIKIAVEGVGHVGYALCQELYEAGAELFVADINPVVIDKAVKNFGATAVDGKAIYGLPVDVYAPCALGASLNDNTIPQLQCKIVAGAANNQLKDEKKHGEMLKAKGILYAPDYVINGGGVINVYGELTGDQEEVQQLLGNIYDTLMQIFETADKSNITTAIAANRIAEERLAKA